MSVKKSGLNFIQLFKAASLSSQIMVIVGSFFTIILIIFVVLGPYIVPQDPYEFSENLLMPPSDTNILGTDNLLRMPPVKLDVLDS